jgi:hypothetical protein
VDIVIKFGVGMQIVPPFGNFLGKSGNTVHDGHQKTS